MRGKIFGLVAVLVAAVCLVIFVFIATMSIELEKKALYFQAVGTLASVIVASIIGISTYSIQRREIASSEAQSRAARIEAATLLLYAMEAFLREIKNVDQSSSDSYRIRLHKFIAFDLNIKSSAVLSEALTSVAREALHIFVQDANSPDEIENRLVRRHFYQEGIRGEGVTSDGVSNNNFDFLVDLKPDYRILYGELRAISHIKGRELGESVG
jgi:hypothetical protein